MNALFPLYFPLLGSICSDPGQHLQSAPQQLSPKEPKGGGFDFEDAAGSRTIGRSACARKALAKPKTNSKSLTPRILNFKHVALGGLDIKLWS